MKPDEKGTQELIDLATGGDAKALAILFCSFERSIRCSLYARGCGDDEVDDVVQETYLYACRSLDSYTGTEPRHFRSWLLMAALSIRGRRVRASVRRRQREAVAVESVELNWRSYLRGAVSGRDDDIMADRVALALAQLRESDREIVTMRYVEDMTSADIAKTLGIKVGALHQRMSVAYQRLRENLSRIPESAV